MTFSTKLRELLAKATAPKWGVLQRKSRWRLYAHAPLGGDGAFAHASVQWNLGDIQGGTPADGNNRSGANAELIIFLRNNAESIVELVEAAKKYTHNYLRDERDDPKLCVSEEHHNDVIALFEAINRMEGND